MKKLINSLTIALFLTLFTCEKVDELDTTEAKIEAEKTIKSSQNVDFQYKTSIDVGGEGSAEITAYDWLTKKLFVVNVASIQISVFNISDINNIVELDPIPITSGSPNSVSVNKGLLAVAVEDVNKQNPGRILVFNTSSQSLINSYPVGALPDMVTFSPNGRFIVSANEGEPNDAYTIDPKGSISIIDFVRGSVSTLEFDSFNGMEEDLEANGFRVFGPGATLAQDVEPEYVAISKNSLYAWVTLQENNGIAKVNLFSKQIETIYPLGYKNYSTPGNEIDPSDRDNVKELNPWPVFGMYQPDAIKYVSIRGVDYVITANEGDSRDYDGFSEEERGADLVLDPDAFPPSGNWQENETLGRIKVTTTLGDTDNDGDYDEIYNYGARSFTIWTGDGQIVYDSGNDISSKTLDLTPDRFNDDDTRSDDKGAEPETVEVLKTLNKYILFVGLERNSQVMVYDITNPASPVFLDILYRPEDQAPEGLLAVPSYLSPTRGDLLIVSNEGSGTVSFYENKRVKNNTN